MQNRNPNTLNESLVELSLKIYQAENSLLHIAYKRHSLNTRPHKKIECKWHREKKKKNSKPNKNSLWYCQAMRFKAKSITRDKEGHFIMMKELIHPKHIKILNLYVLKRDLKYIKQE